VHGLPFIPTQGVQLWVADAGPAIGVPGEPYRSAAERWSTAEWLAPNSCWVDFSDLVEEEDWPHPPPGSLFYFCGPLHLGREPMPQPGQGNNGFTAGAKTEMTSQVIGMLAQVGALLPGTVRNESFRYDRLVDHDGQSTATGSARLGSQYLRPNVVPSELYGVSTPGSTRKRPSPWESGFDNLVLAGDWVYTGLNINSFEAATISGALASYAITGQPDPADIVGYDFLRPNGGPRRP
jgi:hypothetical protein